MTDYGDRDDDDCIEDGFTNSMIRLTSAQPDVVPSRQRREWVEQVEQQLASDPESRRLLGEWKDYLCPNNHGSVRLAQLFVAALVSGFGDDRECVGNLWEGLTLALARASTACCEQKVRDWAFQLAGTTDLSLTPLQELAGSSTRKDRVIPAIVLGSLTEHYRNEINKSATPAVNNSSSNTWLEKLLSFSLQHFCRIDFAKAWLGLATGPAAVTQDTWSETILPPLLTKLKSHPDKTLETIPSWFEAAAVLPLPTDEWQSVLLKQAQSNKEENRNAAHSVIQSWACAPAVGPNVAIIWAQTLVQTKVALSPARLDLLQSVAKLAVAGSKSAQKKTDDGTTLVPKSFVESLAELMSKEPTHKAAAWEAIAAWFMALRVIQPGSSNCTIIIEALADACGKATDDVALILPPLVKSCPSLEVRQTVAAELWQTNPNWSKAMQKIVENQKYKKPEPSLYALYWSLLYFSSQKDVKFPAWVNKVLNGPTTVLYTNVAGSTCSIVAHCLAMAGAQVGSSFFTPKTIRTLALCIGSPQQQREEQSIVLASLREISMLIEPKTVRLLVDELWDRVEAVNFEREEWVTQQNATRQARESEIRPTSVTLTVTPLWNLIRQAAKFLLPKALSQEKAWILTHLGSSVRGSARQRKALVEVAKQHLVKSGEDDWGSRLLDLGPTMSDVSYRATLSLWTTIGMVTMAIPEDEDEEAVADSLSQASANIAEAMMKSTIERVATQLRETLLAVKGLSDNDIGLLRTEDGVPFRIQIPGSSATEKKKRLSEEEEWEEQMRKELAAKKKQAGAGNGTSDSATLSPEDKALVEGQRLERKRIKALLLSFQRLLQAVEYVSLSDIEVGNGALVHFAQPVLIASIVKSPVFDKIRIYRDYASHVLNTMATCVYEIEEKFANDMVQALVISSRAGESSNVLTLEVQALPSPCAPAAAIIHELDDFGDTLSGGSFSFIFPIIRAALMGPRTAPGCESVLQILGRHAEISHGDEYDPILGGFRRDMVICVLELLKHDRAQAFQHPSPLEVLVECYRTDESGGNVQTITTAELAPLLDERGALGPKSCRIGSMMALAEVAAANAKMIKQNPLAENRVWLNCFDNDDDIRNAAQKTWSIIHESKGDALLSPPSPLYAAPLLPLLSSNDASIAEAAAKAFAHAMAQHTGTLNRNVENLCKAYIDAYPSQPKAAGASSLGRPSSSIAVKKPISTGLPKKKAAPKPPAGIASIGKPAGVKKKPSSAAAKALLKPKEERTLDQVALESQFRTTESTILGEDKDTPSRVATRLGVLRALTATTTSSVEILMEEGTLQQLTSFLVAYGIAEIDENVKTAARNTFRDVIAKYGGSEKNVEFLLPQLEAVLKSGVADETALGSLSSEKVPRDVSASDRRREGAVVALGSVALHLKGPENEAKVDSTVDMLIDALKTPSEEVQSSVSDALAKLMKKGRTQERIELIMTNLLRDCLHGEGLAVRRGGAYGLAAAVKGSGIGTLKKLEVVKSLEDAFESGSSNNKEGALFGIELLSTRLGLLFEPYVIVLLPSLLKSFSDGSDYVRKAASHTSSLIMSKLSAHGVKLVTPAVLGAFDDPSWRTKQASIHMLGAMSHLAPKQLAAALPKVVPKLTEAFGDTHPKVKASAQEALNEISTVIKNPEIKSISSSLLKALTDPADYTQPGLEKLIGTEFLHSIDAPSLALIVPILHRGLRDRSATVKRMGGLIAGNICTMINDPRDFVPYIPTLLPDLQLSLLDPIPDVRSTAAKAMGSLSRSLGDQILPQLRPWLVHKLRDESCTSSERSGAAQGLTEVLIACGTSAVDEMLRDEILPLRGHPEASTREGVQWMLSFLPPALGQGFAPFIDASLPAFIGGLSDDSEPVRDVAMRAGRVLIRTHGKVHVDKILPSLEVGIGDDDYRIRVASLSLLGDLLSMIGGTTVVKGDGDTQDDIRRAEKAQAQIALILGAEARKRVLSELYLARSDSVHVVRQNALQVWKTVVSVTARTLRDILPVLVSRIIENLASGHDERTAVAGQCLGDVVSKLGDSVLPQIMPVLRSSLQSGDSKTKLGVCVGLNEVIKASTKEQIVKYIEIIVKVVQDALSDNDPSVRKMAASSFQSLHAMVGNRAFDEVVPSLMVALEHVSDDAYRGRALNGLVGILSVRSRELLPYIIPRLVHRPITTHHAEALAGIAEVTGKSIFYHFSQIIPAILGDLSEAKAEDDAGRISAIRMAAQSICLHVDELGVNILISEIASKCPNDKASMRRESLLLFATTVTERAEKQDFFEQVPTILRELLYRLNDDDASVLKATNTAFTALSTHVPAEELVKHIEFMRNLLASMVSDSRRRKGGVGDGEFFLPGLNMPKGLDPLLPIYQRGILYGSPTIREVSAAGLGEVLNITASKYLAGPLVVKMTGPLLRIVGDRNPSNVKVAILKTLGLILVKGGPALRAFVPQFQTTFVKALSDPSRQVRIEAISALSLLMPLSTRVDPLIKELVSGSLGKNAPDEGAAAVAVQTATLEALTTVLEKGGTKAKLPASISSSLDAAKELMIDADRGVREGAACVMAASCSLLGTEATRETLEEVILSGEDTSTDALHGRLCASRRILASSVGADITSDVPKLKEFALKHTNSEDTAVREVALVALGAAIGRSADPIASRRESETLFLGIMDNSKETIETHRAVALSIAVALQTVDEDARIDFLGLRILDACLRMALGGTQRVQFAFNDVLWIALDVVNGESGLNRYTDIALFDNQKSMKSLHSKVLTRIKEVSLK